MLKVPRLPKLSEVGRERLKRGLLLLIGCGVVLAGAKLLVRKKVVFSGSVPLNQEQMVDFGKKLAGKALGLLGENQGKEGQEGEEGRDEREGESLGEVAGAVQEMAKEPQKAVEKVVEKTVEKKVEEIIKVIKELPEKQAEKIKKEVMKEICKEVCRIE